MSDISNQSLIDFFDNHKPAAVQKAISIASFDSYEGSEKCWQRCHTIDITIYNAGDITNENIAPDTNITSP